MRPYARLVALLLSLAAPGARAATLIYSFTGTISDVDPALVSQFSVGLAVSGSFEIDAATPDGNASPAVGFYPNAGALDFTFGSYAGSGPGGGTFSTITVQNDDGGFDGFDPAYSCGCSAPAVNGFALTGFQFRLLDDEAGSFGSDALPTSLTLADFDTRIVFLNFFMNPDRAVVTAQVEAVTVTIEPACFGEVPTIEGAGKIRGTPGNDVILGSAGNDSVNGAGGSDTICTLGGNDSVSAKAGTIEVDAGPGQDRIRVKTYGNSLNVILGGDDEDVIGFDSGGGGGNTIDGGGSSDTIKAKIGAGDALTGGAGDDEIGARARPNPTIDAGLVVSGGDGDDELSLRGARPQDSVVGDAGADACRADEGSVDCEEVD